MKNIFWLSLITLFIAACDGGVAMYDTGAQRIALIPYGKFDTTLLGEAKEAIEEFYGFDVIYLESRRLPQTAYVKKRRRYQTEQILNYQSELITEDFDKVMGFTTKEITSNAKDSRSSYPVVAKSDRHGPGSVISTYRIKRYTNSKKEFKSRFRKIVVHELGHTLGLNHCTDDEFCMMSDYMGSGRRLDKMNNKLCDECSKKIGWTDLSEEE
jgi:archaemetzincin